MKKSFLIMGLVALFVASCGDTKKEEVKSEDQTTVESTEAKSPEAMVELGAKLFTEKTCTTCHLADTKVIGPSIKDINKIYEEQNGDIVAFLKGVNPAIVDTDPGQVAIMKANLDGFVKDLKQEELEALAAYMASVK